jgi:hypothetical protein
VSVFIHDKQQREDGSIELTVEVTPGIRARKMVAVQLSDDEYRGIIGPSYVLAGKRLLLPDIGIITLPQEEGSSENLIESISARVSRNKRPLETYMARPSPSLESQHAQELGPVGHRLLDRTLIGRAVGKVIFDGLQSIKRGDFEDALDRFRNSQVLGYLGYQFEKNRMFSLNEITESAIIKNIHRVAADSWFHVQKRLVNPSVGCLRIGIEPRTPDEHALIARWQKEIALIYGEEYTHAYQDWKGGHVSRHAALIDDLSNEADVAALFFDQGVSLSVDFIKNRYPERETALARIVGAQTSADVEAFGKALFRLPLGATLTIGRNPELKPGGESFPIVSSITRHGEGIGRAERQRERAVKTLHETEISVTKARDGSFLMQAEHPNTRAFYRDQEGDVQVLRGPVSLAPGSTIYLGDSFRFNLECITK